MVPRQHTPSQHYRLAPTNGSLEMTSDNAGSLGGGLRRVECWLPFPLGSQRWVYMAVPGIQCFLGLVSTVPQPFWPTLTGRALLS